MRVSDASGAVMQGVTVHAMSQATGVALHTVTDDTGLYRFESVVPGLWEVSFAGAGFDTAQKTVQLNAEPVVFNVTLGMSASAQAGAQGGQQTPPMPNLPDMPQPSAQPAPQVAPEPSGEESADPKALLARGPVSFIEEARNTLHAYIWKSPLH